MPMAPDPMGEAEGLIKTVFDAKTGELIGAHMIGSEVTESTGTSLFAMGPKHHHTRLVIGQALLSAHQKITPLLTHHNQDTHQMVH